jgi:hypothetical protein
VCEYLATAPRIFGEEDHLIELVSDLSRFELLEVFCQHGSKRLVQSLIIIELRRPKEMLVLLRYASEYVQQFPFPRVPLRVRLQTTHASEIQGDGADSRSHPCQKREHNLHVGDANRPGGP